MYSRLLQPARSRAARHWSPVIPRAKRRPRRCRGVVEPEQIVFVHRVHGANALCRHAGETDLWPGQQRLFAVLGEATRGRDLHERVVLSKAEKDALASPMRYLAKQDTEDVVTRRAVRGIGQ